jgi:hypothetical protein
LARKGTSPKGRDRLEEAMVMLVQNQAAFVNRLPETDRAHSEFERGHLEIQREIADRFAHIESQLKEIIRVLAEHGRLLERLPEMIRESIGFQGQP